MASARTGVWSALGALVVGAAGALAGREIARAYPDVTYSLRRRRGGPVTDAMVAGGAAGAIVGAFIGGALSGDSSPAALPR